jgi:predicted MFS family arabinose efflux permease
MVCASTWCLGELSRNRAPQLGAWIYTGVGIGIVLAGLLAWLGGQQTAKTLWLELGLLAAAGTAIVWYGLTQNQSDPSKPSEAVQHKTQTLKSKNHFGLVLCYGTFGFGYIVQATFLPTMARQQISDPLVFGLTWPIFGLAATLSVCLCAYWLKNWPRRRVWAIAQFVMALGTLIPLLTQAIEALALSAVFVGGTFMVTTMAGLQHAREQAPANPMPLLAKMTMAFALGQIAGPLFVRLLGPAGVAGWDAFTCTNALATVTLLVSAIWLWRPWHSAEPR